MTLYAPYELACGESFPRATPDPATGLSAPLALHYDGVTKQWLLDGDEWASVHPADQAVALACCFRRGSLAPTPTVGFSYHLSDVDDEQLDSDLLERTRAAEPLSQYLADGTIELVQVFGERVESGGIKVRVEYRNWALSNQIRSVTTVV